MSATKAKRTKAKRETRDLRDEIPDVLNGVVGMRAAWCVCEQVINAIPEESRNNVLLGLVLALISVIRHNYEPEIRPESLQKLHDALNLCGQNMISASPMEHRQ